MEIDARKWCWPDQVTVIFRSASTAAAKIGRFPCGFLKRDSKRGEHERFHLADAGFEPRLVFCCHMCMKKRVVFLYLWNFVNSCKRFFHTELLWWLASPHSTLWFPNWSLSELTSIKSSMLFPVHCARMYMVRPDVISLFHHYLWVLGDEFVIQYTSHYAWTDDAIYSRIFQHVVNLFPLNHYVTRASLCQSPSFPGKPTFVSIP